MQGKIKAAMVTNHFDVTGIATVIMNYAMALDKNKFDLTILAGKPIAEQYRKACGEYGINLIPLPSRRQTPGKHYLALWKALKAGGYHVIHDHGNSSMMAIELTIARLAGIKIRIAHSHNSTCPNWRIHKILNPYFRKVYTKALACGELAGDWLFGSHGFEVLPNGFHTDEFAFSPRGREVIRTQLQAEDKFIIGHIGRMNAQKNQEYLLKVFEKAALRREDAILMMVGSGPDYEKLRDQIECHPYRDRIILYGETENPSDIYSSFDVFVFPSRYEGLPVVLLEAQISGLPCVVSDRVTHEVDFGDIIWKSIDEAPDQWSDTIVKIKPMSVGQRSEYKINHGPLIETYDISQSVKQLDGIYTDLIKQVK